MDAACVRLVGELVDDWLDRHTYADAGHEVVATGNTIRVLRWRTPAGRLLTYERLAPGGDFHLRPA